MRESMEKKLKNDKPLQDVMDNIVRAENHIDTMESQRELINS